MYAAVKASLNFSIDSTAGATAILQSFIPGDAIFTPTDKPNSPMGIAKGIFPGRVVWCYNPNAAKWSGNKDASSSDSFNDWHSESNTIQSEVNKMISESICTLTEKNSDAEAWDALFKYFNKTHQKGKIGYQQGEKIAVKLNLNSGDGHCNSPQMVLGLLK